MAFKIKGPVYGGGERNKEGHRNWTVKHMVLFDQPTGPAAALKVPGIPVPGDMYLFDDDVDPWAWCGLEARITPYSNSPQVRAYWVEQTFSSAPNTKWCKDQQIDDPLLQRPKISGNFIRYTEEATYDRWGNLLQNSAHEQIRGPQVEFDADRIQIEIEQNVIDLNLPLLILLDNSVNAYPLWGAAPRMIKFTPGAWSMNFYGNCFKYFTRKLIFEAKKDGWDRVVLDEGTKALNGDWNRTPNAPAEWILQPINGLAPNPKNPAHFKRYKDRSGENTKTVLDGLGKPFIPQAITMVTSCTKAPKSPSKWLLSGIVNEDDLQSSVFLNHAGSCTWTGTWTYEFGNPDTKAITLVYIPPNPISTVEGDFWKLTIEGIVGPPPFDNAQEWTIRNSKWKQLGPNTLNNPNLDIDPLVPPKFTVTTGNVPGVRSIQKYEGSDFLLLGVPANL